jgi:hypothetical protein
LTTTLYAGGPEIKPKQVPAGFDLWQTVGGGATAMDFSEDPIPKGFFCEGSEAYTGKVKFEGVPLTTEPAGLLGVTDTVIERLDDAVFENDKATSRLRVKAINLTSRNPIQTSCGNWNLAVGLADGQQPLSTILYSKKDDFSGTFNATLKLTIEITFSNAEDPNDLRFLTRTIDFTEFHDTPFVLSPSKGRDLISRSEIAKKPLDANAYSEPVFIDTNADGDVDNILGLVVTSPTTGITTTTTAPVPTGSIRWWTWNGWLCHYGTYPPHSSCIPLTLWHTAPLHNHVTVPVCGEVLAEETYELVAPEETEEVPCLTAMTSQLENLALRGLLDIPVEQLLQEMKDKMNRNK